MNKKAMILSARLIVSLYPLIFSLPLSQAAAVVTLSVGDGAGIKGTNCCNPNYPDSNKVEISLDNTTDLVKEVNFTLCDVDDYLYLSGFERTSRTYGFNVLASETPEGCVEVSLDDPDGFLINQGTGPILTLKFDVVSDAPLEQFRYLTLSNVQILDLNGVPLDLAFGSGKFYFYNCGIAMHCDDGVFCNGEEYCLAGFCMSSGSNPCPQLSCVEENDECSCDQDSQCNDGDLCNGDETCVGGECLPGSPPCTDDQDPCTDDCDQGACIQSCNAAGPWDVCCTTSQCASDDICTTEVTLTVDEDNIASGVPGSPGNLVEVSLDNQSLVKAVLVAICDMDDNYLTCTGCNITTRTTNYSTCDFNEREDGCCVALLSNGNNTISPGSGPIFTLEYDVSGGAPFGQCRDSAIDLTIDTETFSIIDSNNIELDKMPVAGDFCVPCNEDSDCADNNACIEEKHCVDGMCEYINLIDPCNDDEFDDPYCNGVKYCAEGGGCSSAGDPCASLPNPLTCDEVNNLCVGSDVTLTIDGSQSTIDILLTNNINDVSEVHLNVCDVDQRSWLHIATDSCSTTSRTSGYHCIPTDLGNGCVGIDLLSSFPLDLIEMGSGAIAQLDYTLDPVPILMENYADLNPEASNVWVRVCSGGSNPDGTCYLDSDCPGGTCGKDLKVTPKPGRLYAEEYCSGDLNCDESVNGIDTTLYLEDLPRNPFNHPCTSGDPCIGDLNCDGSVNGIDTILYLEDLPRNPFNRPCPPCSPQFTCEYD